MTGGLLRAERLSAITWISLTVQPVGDDICEEGDEFSRGVPCTEQQDQAYTTRLIGASRLACGSLCQFHLFHFRQRNRAANEHEFIRF